MYWQSHRYYHRIAWFLQIFCFIFKLIFACFGGSFFNVFLRSFLVSFWAPGRLFKLTPKSRKTRAKPKSVQGPFRGRFWSRFGDHFGVILGAFWNNFGSVLVYFLQIHPEYMQIRADTRKYCQICANASEVTWKLFKIARISGTDSEETSLWLQNR